MSTQTETQNIPQSLVFKKQVWFFVPAILFFVGLLALIFTVAFRAERHRIQNEQLELIRLAEDVVTDNFDSVIADLRVLSESTEVKVVLYSENADARHSLGNRFLDFAVAKGVYDQIRLFDLEGNEIVRVNYNNGDPEIVPNDQLQNQVGRYYFDETIALDEDQIYVSALDLNVENGEVEQPEKPTVRFGMPVVDAGGNKRGILVLNYLGDDMLGHLRSLTTRDNNQAMLVNTDAFWLMGAPETSFNWGFMYEGDPDMRKALFYRQYPDIWRYLARSEQGQFYSNGMFSITPLYPLRDSPIADNIKVAVTDKVATSADYRWYFVSYVPGNLIGPWQLGRLRLYLGVGSILILASFFVTYFVARLLLRNERDQREIRLHRDALEELVQQRTADLNNANRYLHYANDEMRSFTSIVSHDLRSPIASIRGFLQELEMDWESLKPELDTAAKDERARRTIEQHIPESFDLIKVSVDQMERLTKGILGVARYGRRELSLKQINLNNLMRIVRADNRQFLDEHNVKMSIAADLPTVLADEIALEQVMNNLIGNAIKYRDLNRDLRINISTEQNATHTLIHVQDTARGITQDEIENIFRLYRRGDVGEVEGEGIGLYAVRGLVRRHGGDLSVTSEPGVGSTFTFSVAHQIDDVQIEEQGELVYV